jgi:hypothetical protein
MELVQIYLQMVMSTPDNIIKEDHMGKGSTNGRMAAFILESNMYEGEYADDKKNGMGHFIWESGN